MENKPIRIHAAVRGSGTGVITMVSCSWNPPLRGFPAPFQLMMESLTIRKSARKDQLAFGLAYHSVASSRASAAFAYVRAAGELAGSRISQIAAWSPLLVALLP